MGVTATSSVSTHEATCEMPTMSKMALKFSNNPAMQIGVPSTIEQQKPIEFYFFVDLEVGFCILRFREHWLLYIVENFFIALGITLRKAISKHHA
jgi:hypothetical protein